MKGAPRPLLLTFAGTPASVVAAAEGASIGAGAKKAKEATGLQTGNKGTGSITRQIQDDPNNHQAKAAQLLALAVPLVCDSSCNKCCQKLMLHELLGERRIDRTVAAVATAFARTTNAGG